MTVKTPLLTVDILIESVHSGRIVLIRRRNPPEGWALPGGFVEPGETVEQAAAREAFEETGLRVERLRQFHVYSDPARDPRGHTVSVVFTAGASGEPCAGDDAKSAAWFDLDNLPGPLAFDHHQIIMDFTHHRQGANHCESSS